MKIKWLKFQGDSYNIVDRLEDSIVNIQREQWEQRSKLESERIKQQLSVVTKESQSLLPNEDTNQETLAKLERGILFSRGEIYQSFSFLQGTI